MNVQYEIHLNDEKIIAGSCEFLNIIIWEDYIEIYSTIEHRHNRYNWKDIHTFKLSPQND